MAVTNNTNIETTISQNEQQHQEGSPRPRLVLARELLDPDAEGHGAGGDRVGHAEVPEADRVAAHQPLHGPGDPPGARACVVLAGGAPARDLPRGEDLGGQARAAQVHRQVLGEKRIGLMPYFPAHKID